MITSKVVENKESSNDFPKLMKSKASNAILLFTNPESGVVLISDTHWDIGYFSKGWSSDSFEDFTGELTLKNNK
jgi:hypothetical protein